MIGTRPATDDRRLILYVEDDHALRTTYATTLRRAGFRVAEATSWSDGFDRAVELHPDLVLMDLGLQAVEGCAATARLKHHPRTSDIPVLALDPPEEAGHLCDAYIAKPSHEAEVVRHVLHFLARIATRSQRRGARHFGPEAPSAQPHDSMSSSQSHE